MPISDLTYEQVALEDPEGKWELHCGQLRSKPVVTFEHGRIAWILGFRLQQQLDLEQYEVRVDAGRARRADGRFYIPDVMVVPTALIRRMLRERPRRLEVYDEPLPLVVEVWSPSTGEYDVDEKLPEYQRRGDLEIWRIHPYDRNVTVWRRQPDGSYTESLHRGGTIQPAALPNVLIDLDELLILS